MTSRDRTDGTHSDGSWTSAIGLTEAQLRAVFDHAIDGVITFDSVGRVLGINPAAERIFGYPASELRGQDVSKLMGTSHWDGDGNLGSHTKEGGAALGSRHSVEARRSSGQRLYLDMSVSEAAVGSSRMFTAIVRDVTERRAQEQALYQRKHEATQAARMLELGEVVADLAHNINQPLAAISSFAAAGRRMVCSMADAPESLDTALERIVSQVERANQIVRRLRGFVHTDATRAGAVDVNTIVLRTLALVERELCDERVQASVRLDEDVAAVLADPLQLEHLLLNLIRNGIDAMRPTPESDRRIELETRRASADAVSILVRDTGSGMSAESHERVFDIFHTTKPGRAGLGLALGRSIAEAHGGTLHIDTMTPQGTTMRLTLPAART